MAGVVLGRKFCSSCKHWRHLIFFHVHTKDVEGNPVRWQSRCETCNRIHKRITEGRRLRGFRYNPHKRTDPEKLRARARARNTRRMNSRRRGDPLVPLKPLADALDEISHEFDSMRQFASYLGADRENLKRLIAQVDVRKDGEIRKWLDIRLSMVDDILTKLEIPLPEVYDPDKYPWLYEDRRPRNFAKAKRGMHHHRYGKRKSDDNLRSSEDTS
jgi:hypothetical protein